MLGSILRMRENQHIIFSGPLGMRIFDDGKLHEKQSPPREIQPDVLRWRLGQRSTNPQSAADTVRFESNFSDAGIINETSINQYIFGITTRLP